MSVQVTYGQQLERTQRIAQEFSDLIVYCRTVPYDLESKFYSLFLLDSFI